MVICRDMNHDMVDIAKETWLSSPGRKGRDTNRASATDSITRRPAGAPWRVLIVEDQALVALDLSAAFMRSGFEAVSIAATCEDAVRKAAATRADVVVADIHLGDGDDGITATQRIRAQHRIPVLYVTAYREPEILDRLETGPDIDVFFKPFNVTSLIAVVRRLLQQQ